MAYRSTDSWCILSYPNSQSGRYAQRCTSIPELCLDKKILPVNETVAHSHSAGALQTKEFDSSQREAPYKDEAVFQSVRVDSNATERSNKNEVVDRLVLEDAENIGSSGSNAEVVTSQVLE